MKRDPRTGEILIEDYTDFISWEVSMVMPVTETLCKVRIQKRTPQGEVIVRDVMSHIIFIPVETTYWNRFATGDTVMECEHCGWMMSVVEYESLRIKPYCIRCKHEEFRRRLL